MEETVSGHKREREEKEDPSLSLYELVQEEEQLVQDAQQGLQEHWGEEGQCTYPAGAHRQNVFACATCQAQPGVEAPFGFCYGCSMQCHVHHQVYELYTKRHFRCDCGLPGHPPCELLPKSDCPPNANRYNHNYHDRYCFCDGSYQPDTDEMLQCYVCQDWFHVECLEEAAAQGVTHPLTRPATHSEKKEEENKGESSGATAGQAQEGFQYVPEEREEGDMICQGCMGLHAFLWNYAPWQQPLPALASSPSAPAPPSRNLECTRPSIPPPSRRTSTFWWPGWRTQLCTCETCQKLYEEHELSFLLEEAQVDEGEEEEEGAALSPDKATASALEAAQSVDLDATGMKELQAHVPSVSAQLNILHEVDYMQEELRRFLAPLAQSGTVVTKEHIQEFFAQLQERKRRRLE